MKKQACVGRADSLPFGVMFGVERRNGQTEPFLEALKNGVVHLAIPVFLTKRQ